MPSTSLAPHRCCQAGGNHNRPTTFNILPDRHSQFHHQRINHSEEFVSADNHINGIENFWSQAKRHLRRYNGIPKAHFNLFLKECEWRFNHRPPSNLLKPLNTWTGL